MTEGQRWAEQFARGIREKRADFNQAFADLSDQALQEHDRRVKPGDKVRATIIGDAAGYEKALAERAGREQAAHDRVVRVQRRRLRWQLWKLRARFFLSRVAACALPFRGRKR